MMAWNAASTCPAGRTDAPRRSNGAAGANVSALLPEVDAGVKVWAGFGCGEIRTIGEVLTAVAVTAETYRLHHRRYPAFPLLETMVRSAGRQQESAGFFANPARSGGMDIVELEQVVKNVDDRVRRIEQILSTLATKEDLKAYATKEDLRAAIAPLATKAEVRQEGERTRQHFNAVAERLESKIELVAEGQVALQAQFEHFRHEIKEELAQHDRRIMRLDATRGQRPSRTKPK